MVLRPKLLALLLLGLSVQEVSAGNANLSSLIWAFALTLGLLLAAGFGAPIPEELPIVGAGVWVSQQPEFGWPRWLILPVCILGVVTSDGCLYGMGRYFGGRLLENRFTKRFVPTEKREKIQENFQKYGVWALLFARFLPAIRSPIFVTAGIMRLSLTKFLLADGLYAIPGVSGIFFLSWWFGDQFKVLLEGVENKMQRLRLLIILLFLAGLVGVLLYHFLRRPVSTGDPKELPILGGKVAAKVDATMQMMPAPKTEIMKKEDKPPSSNGEAHGAPLKSDEAH
jgi:membrane protein DedA with SNARE-associated domain